MLSLTLVRVSEKTGPTRALHSVFFTLEQMALRKISVAKSLEVFSSSKITIRINVLIASN